MRLARTVVASALLAACGHPSPRPIGNVAPPAQVPADLLTRAAGQARPVLVRGDVAYLWLQLVDDDAEGGEPAIAEPACVAASDNNTCWDTLAAPAARVAALGPVPPRITVVTATGTCTATVGPAVVVNTSGCEPSMTLAAPLTGCGAELAPIAFVGADAPPDLRWSPVPEIMPVDVPAELATIADPLQRQAMTSWLDDPEFKAGTRHETKTTEVAVDVGGESLTTLIGAALVGDDPDQCQWSTPYREVVGIRRGDQLTKLDLPAMWDGALSWHGRVVGVVSGLPTDVTVVALGADGAITPVMTQTIWGDNPECLQRSWSGIEYPCGL